MHLLATDSDADPAVVDTLNAAARRALDRAAPEAAVVYLRRALDEPPPPSARLGVLHDLVVATFRAGDRSGFEELVASGTWAELTADRQVLLESAGDLAQVLYNWDRDEELAVLLDRAADAAIEVGDYDRATRFQGYRTFWTRMPPARRPRCSRAFGAASSATRRASASDLALQAHWGLLTGEPRAAVVELAARAVEDGKILREHPDSPMPTVAHVRPAVPSTISTSSSACSPARPRDQRPWRVGDRERLAGSAPTLAFLRGDVAAGAKRRPDRRARCARRAASFPRSHRGSRCSSRC